MTTALSGPNQFLGQAIRDGMLKRFTEANERDEIPGKTIELIVLDDSYDPDEAFKHAQTLIDVHKVIALVGNVGTPTAARTEPLANEKSVVFYGAFTGADILRQTPPKAYTFNFRPSYDQEMQVIVDHLLAQGVSPRKVAFFLQRDGYGRAGYRAAGKALLARGFEYTHALKTIYYERNTLSIQAGIEELIRAQLDPQAIIIVGSYQASGEFIRIMHRIYPKLLFYNLSFAGAPMLANVLPKIDKRIYMTQVVPVMEAWEAHAAKNQRTFDTSYMDAMQTEGYLSASILMDALKKIHGEINSKNLKQALEQMGEFYLEPLGRLSFAKGDHQASDRVWLAEFNRRRQWVAVEDNN